MVKYKNESEECIYKINPLGRGLSLCAYNAVKEKKLDSIKLKDFPVCNKNKCFKTEDKTQ